MKITEKLEDIDKWNINTQDKQDNSIKDINL